MPKREPDPRELLPLTPVVLHMLLGLAESGQHATASGKHGYALAQEVEAMTDGQVRMGPGTLYGSIQRMLASGLIEEVSRARLAARVRGVQGEDDERRRYYRLTMLGHRVLQMELARLAQVMAIARAKRLLPSPEPA